MTKSNEEKIKEIDLFDAICNAAEDGIGFNANPIDVTLHIFEQAGLTLPKERIEQLHKLRDRCEQEQ